MTPAAGRALRALWILVCATLLAAGGLQAQTVQPAVAELSTGKAVAPVDGHFELINNTLEPMIVTIEAKSFTIGNDGVAAFRPLSPEVHLDLTENSLRLWPRQRRTIFYRVSAPRYPTWFCIYSNFSSAVHRSGVQVQIEMPHTVYLLDRTRASAAEVRFTALRHEGGALHGTVQNTSATLVRVISLEVAGKSGKAQVGGFPLLPGGEREFSVADMQGPVHLRARTATFQVEGELQ